MANTQWQQSDITKLYLITALVIEQSVGLINFSVVSLLITHSDRSGFFATTCGELAVVPNASTTSTSKPAQLNCRSTYKFQSLANLQEIQGVFVSFVVGLSHLRGHGYQSIREYLSRTIKQFDCSDISDCNNCNENQCQFVEISCNNNTKNETSCRSKDETSDSNNCTIINKIENCTNLTVTTEASTNGSTGSTSVPQTSTDKEPQSTLASTLTSTLTSTTTTTTVEPITKATSESVIVTSPKSTLTPTVASSTASSSIDTSYYSPNSIQPSSVPDKSSRFDTGSFIGGIVLTLGLMAIAFVGYKFYRARTEHNYHTLHETVHM
uniref:Uncharacterized protein n=1 Tax=Strigamia maritima TaxID=126957 RepID=T1JDL8_STRMM